MVSLSQPLLFRDHGVSAPDGDWGFVYLMGERPNDGQWKIGFSQDSPERRLDELKTGNPRLYLADKWWIKNAKWHEGWLHRWLNDFNVRKLCTSGAKDWFWLERDAKGMNHGETGLKFMHRYSSYIAGEDWGKYADAAFAIIDSVSKNTGRTVLPRGLTAIRLNRVDPDGYAYPTFARDELGFVYESDGGYWDEGKMHRRNWKIIGLSSKAGVG